MYYFIVNPKSRSGEADSLWHKLEQELISREVDYQACLTEYPGHATELAASLSLSGTKENPVVLVAIGGDGTIHEILSGIADFDSVILGYIPTGSGNDFGRSMKLPTDPLESLNYILDARNIRQLDVPYLVQDHKRSHFGISSGIGFDAAVCRELFVTPLKKILNRFGLGKLTYLAVALQQLYSARPTKMTLTLDEKESISYDRVYFTAIMNQKYEGGGFQFCPDARYDDQLLDVILIEGISKLKVLICLPTAFFGKHTKIKGVHIYQAKTIQVQTDTPLPVHLDGEFGGNRQLLEAAIEKKPLKIILPVI